MRFFTLFLILGLYANTVFGSDGSVGLHEVTISEEPPAHTDHPLTPRDAMDTLNSRTSASSGTSVQSIVQRERADAALSKAAWMHCARSGVLTSCEGVTSTWIAVNLLTTGDPNSILLTLSSIFRIGGMISSFLNVYFMRQNANHHIQQAESHGNWGYLFSKPQSLFNAAVGLLREGVYTALVYATVSTRAYNPTAAGLMMAYGAMNIIEGVESLGVHIHRWGHNGWKLW